MVHPLSSGTLVAPAQRSALLPYTDVGRPIEARVTSVSAAGTADGLEARVRLATDRGSLRAGASGLAKITVRRSTAWGALWWAIRKRVRSDLLL